LRVEAPFELRDALGDDRRRDAEVAGRSREAPETGDAYEGGNVLQRIDGVLSPRKQFARFVAFCPPAQR